MSVGAGIEVSEAQARPTFLTLSAACSSGCRNLSTFFNIMPDWMLHASPHDDIGLNP